MSGKETKKGRAKAILKRVIPLLLILLLGVQILWACLDARGGEKLAMPFGFGAAAVLSGSMEPTFSKGDMIVAYKTSELEIGDVVVFGMDGHLVVHRVIGLDGDTVTTQGDANNTPDPEFDRSAVSGVVAFWIPRAGDLVNTLKTPYGLALIAGVLLLIILLPGFLGKDEDEEAGASGKEKSGTRGKRPALPATGNTQEERDG